MTSRATIDSNCDGRSHRLKHNLPSCGMCRNVVWVDRYIRFEKKAVAPLSVV